MPSQKKKRKRKNCPSAKFIIVCIQKVRNKRESLEKEGNNKRYEHLPFPPPPNDVGPPSPQLPFQPKIFKESSVYSFLFLPPFPNMYLIDQSFVCIFIYIHTYIIRERERRRREKVEHLVVNNNY